MDTKAKAFISKGLSLSANVIFLRLVIPAQFCDKNLPVTPAGTITSVIEEQPDKYSLPIEVAVAGTGSAVSATQPLKLLRPIFTQVGGNTIEVTSLQFKKALAAVATTV
ncbi:Uncharacterised protein [Chlamydia trachomatis]|nr:Uncharacterised protein [Chlamydia trachomatis]